ncbi:uncharacterized protein LOC121759078 [Salvia splendens]|uniref:uncharacterized protein LOC121759078 n=1 Tax=Salvia splendens TaxID=180675 RepID=UPI001C280B82|nr:uncharacterized protein LOC121759078 [Salvia splendens]
MTGSQSGVERSEVMCSLPVVTSPVVSQLSESPALDPVKTLLEHLVANMARFEVRMDDFERRSMSTRHAARPDPDPPYSGSTTETVAAAIPSLPPSSAISIAIPSCPPAASVPFLGFQEGFRPNPTGPQALGHRFSGPPHHSSWDAPPASRPSAAWDAWGHRPLPEQQFQNSGPVWEPQGSRQWASSHSSDRQAGLTMKPPRFDGSNVVSWISRVQFYFDHCRLVEDQRLHYAVMLFEPSVAEWVFNYREGNPAARWSEFLEDVRHRFDPQCFVDYFGVIAKLCQTGSLEKYNSEFEGMLNRVRGVPSNRLVTLYVEGLQQPVRNQVKFQYPPSVAAAMALAVEFDAATDKPPPKQSFQRRAWLPREQTQQPPPLAITPSGATPGAEANRGGQPKGRSADFAGLPVVRISAAERAEHTRKGLCWYCPDKWIPGHVCKGKFLVYMGMDDEELEPEESDPPAEEIITADLSHIYAMGGRPHSASMELRGQMGREQVTILVDTGSSHDFLHPQIAEKLKLPLTAVRPFRVYVGNGASLVCSFASVATEFFIQQEKFIVTLHILPVHGLDVVLGLSWLHSLRRVTNDFVKGTIEFLRDDVPVCLKVAPSVPREVSNSAAASLLRLRGEANVFEVLQLAPDLGTTEDAMVFPSDLSAPVLSVLERHRAVFQLPSGMPPARPFDHRIHLLPNSKPVNVRPYRYPYFQKTEIERQVKEMLDAGIIRRSQSPFSSPVLLIRKNDGSFCFCIDYRALNAATVPDHFPIPTTDELFDELGAARVFTKLDLREGYHQIRMNSEDVFKTAFRTHDGHFEFLVMPFGLTNAPSTFQAAMNDIFRPLLRQSVMVFFDDILIYSPTLERHTEQLHEVLSILQAHSFFVKLSKCTFCCSTVDYLGHLIEAGQLKPDPSKIEAMVAWPKPTTVKQLRGFLGLTGYYRRFIAGYASIAAPLTELLKKDAFAWSSLADDSFGRLKEAMTSAPVLRLPDFSKVFYVETDASDFGVGAVLLQDGHPLAFFSKKLGPRRRVTSTYHKELYAIVEAVQKWRQYLLGREFVIRSDQKRLKDLLH